MRRKRWVVGTMKCRILSVVAAAVIAGLVVYDLPPDVQQAPEPIDFTQLNSRAVAALRSLERSQAQRIGVQADDAARASIP
jgi:hypothetical protein